MQARARLGLLVLDTRFPRPAGDLGNPASWPWEVDVEVVRGAWPSRIVQSAAGLRDSGVLPAFVQAARALQGRGAAAIASSCGFLVLLQSQLQAAVGVPVVTSSLLALPQLITAERRVGVLTISAASLGPEHLLAAGVPQGRLHDVLVQGINPAGEFATAILGNRETMDMQLAEHDVVDAAVRLKAQAPDLRTLVLECTNMPPHAPRIVQATGCRVVSLRDSQVLLAAMAPPHAALPLP